MTRLEASRATLTALLPELAAYPLSDGERKQALTLLRELRDLVETGTGLVQLAPAQTGVEGEGHRKPAAES